MGDGGGEGGGESHQSQVGYKASSPHPYPSLNK